MLGLFIAIHDAPVRALMGVLMRAASVLFLAVMIVVTGTTVGSAGMIRDSEIEAGLETLIAPMVTAAGFAPGEIARRPEHHEGEAIAPGLLLRRERHRVPTA